MVITDQADFIQGNSISDKGGIYIIMALVHQEYITILITNLQNTCHILGHKTNFNKFKVIGITESIFSDRNIIKPENSNRMM